MTRPTVSRPARHPHAHRTGLNLPAAAAKRRSAGGEVRSVVLRLCVTKFGDPLYRTDELFAELCRGPFGEVMALAVA